MSGRPGPEVCAAFGVTDQPVLLEGGQGEAWRCGGLVLKGADEPSETAWVAELVASLSLDPRVRIVEHVRAVDGSWTWAGWEATRWVPGTEGPAGRWDDLLSVCDAVSALLAGCVRPDVLDRRDHRWARADRMVWDGARVPPEVAGDPLVRQLSQAVAPLSLPQQLVHGDLCGNVLFDDPAPPLVIDLSLYWRPVGHARAMVVVDGLLWHDAPASLAAAEALRPHGADLLLRALLFRRIVAVLSTASSGAEPYGRYSETTDLLLDLTQRPGSRSGPP